MATYQYIGDRCPDGTIIGKDSTQALAFYGGTPMTKSTFTAATIATTAAVSTTTGAITSWGFSTSTQANAIFALANEIRALLVTLGLAA